MKRTEAARQGLHKYQSEKPCRRGHWVLRYTDTGACTSCVAIYNRGFRSQRINVRTSGLDHVEIDLHPEDATQVRELARTLQLARQYS